MALIVNILILYWVFVSLNEAASPESGDLEPDVFRNITELVTSKGYPMEEHVVQTKDGYLLGVQRIPHGRRVNTIFGHRRASNRVVLLHHGIMGSATDYVINMPEQSLGFILADAGYDVWLTNVRGSTYSRKHVTLSPKSPEFWKFSWDEIALLDLPATIDYILNTTGQSSLFFAGVSMGTTVMFALLSEQPEYNQKIRASVAMCPVAFAGNMRGPIRLAVPFANDFAFITERLGMEEFLPGSLVEKLVMEFLCFEEPHVCQNLVLVFTGSSQKHLNATRSPVYLSHKPCGTSIRTLLHYAQLIKSKAFRKFDYGPTENMERYGQVTPPDYRLSNITAPIALMWSLNDEIADPADVHLLAPLLRNLTIMYQVSDPEWSHSDFDLAMDANLFVYSKLMEILKTF